MLVLLIVCDSYLACKSWSHEWNHMVLRQCVCNDKAGMVAMHNQEVVVTMK